MVDNPFALVTKSQEVAVKLALETIRTVRDTAVTGVTHPDELVRQVANLAGALSGLATATAQPLQDFVVRQRELAETVATLASAQAELAAVVATLAERHADAVSALETLSAPVFALARTEPATAPKKAPAKPARKSASKTAKR